MESGLNDRLYVNPSLSERSGDSSRAAFTLRSTQGTGDFATDRGGGKKIAHVTISLIKTVAFHRENLKRMVTDDCRINQVRY